LPPLLRLQHRVKFPVSAQFLQVSAIISAMNKSCARLPRLLLLYICILFAVRPLLSQNATAPTSSVAPDPKPRDPSAGWKRFGGVYEYSDDANYKQTVGILMTNLGWRMG